MEEESEASSHGDECKPLSNGEYEVEVTTRLSKAEKKKLKEERKLEKVRRRLLHRKENKKAKKQRHSGEEVSDEKPVVLKSDLAAKLQHGMECGQNVCIDLYFEDQHLQKEKSSIATQLVLLYAFLKRSEVPIHLSLCSLDPTSFVFSSLQKQGMDHWYMDKHSAGVEQIFPKDRLVYLSPDATEVLETIEADKVYVIGGIVDRTVKKNLTLDKAQQHGVRVVRFPVQEYIPTRVNHILNIDTCVQIICLYLQYKDWPRALGEAIPHRKQQKRKKDANMDDEKEACSNDVAVLSGSNAEEHVVEEVVGEHDGVSSR